MAYRDCVSNVTQMNALSPKDYLIDGIEGSVFLSDTFCFENPGRGNVRMEYHIHSEGKLKENEKKSL